MDNKKRDFLLEDKFVEWQLLQTDELNKYWDNFRRDNPDLSDDLDNAILEFKSVSIELNNLESTEKQEILNNIFSKIKKKNHVKTFIQAISSIAAIAIIGVFITYTLNTFNNESAYVEETIIGQTMPEEDVYIISGENKTKLANNSNLELTKDKKAVVVDSTEETQEVDLAKAANNRLVVPYGKRSNITLADGSKIWLNSGTQLDFPSEFSDKSREIYVNGEAYIEVNKDNRPFIVNTSKMAVQVYGTSFNVSAYEEDNTNSVVLVEGKVGVKPAGASKESFISPNEKLDLSPNGEISTEIVNISEYISWTKDVLEFDETPVSEILRKIGRYYNVQFDNSPDIALNEQTCSGKLFLSNNLDSVMTSISILSSTKYERNDNLIHIQKK